ncbi:response regulator transcription factor [Alicyclobacillus mengziensis]|uniref:Response regulator transcription factor n=1 Tax=Alicyclobacillus mengziensis TaxID=2931921 RepID=A0A9X7W071_9BACL|nr:response regulator transcription factor [Alicyclobacillus mengziensis]QSO48328.1 response regulator transcription factor [Alicyclobacillus mengziensis]
MTRVLVVDDEKSILKLVEYNLTQAGFEVITAENGHHAVELVRSDEPDLLILDLMLPGMDGLQVCKTLRSEGIHTPVIMLTARDDEIDRILGLELGADDYVTKPFSPRELVARVRAVLRRLGQQNDDKPDNDDKIMEIGSIRIDSGKHEVYVRDKRIELTSREFELLVYLCRHTGNVLSRNQLLENVWGYDYPGDTRIVDVHISHLRDKIELNPKSPDIIKTVRGVGYKLTP